MPDMLMPDAAEQERLGSLQNLRQMAEDEVEKLREVLLQTRRGRIRLQLEAVS